MWVKGFEPSWTTPLGSEPSASAVPPYPQKNIFHLKFFIFKTDYILKIKNLYIKYM